MPEPTKTYAGVLNQLAGITFGYMCACVWLLCQWAPTLNMEPTIEIDALKISIPAYWLAGIVVCAFIFRLIKLHDRVSDLFGIRKRYDYMHIMHPLFVGSKPGAAIPVPQDFVEKRQRIMKAVFYKYTRAEGPNVIDGHFVEMVWESLRWFWAIVEALVVTVSFAVFCLLTGELSAALYFGLLLLLLGILYPVAERYCIRQTSEEVTEILGDATRRTEIGRAFDEILN